MRKNQPTVRRRTITSRDIQRHTAPRAHEAPAPVRVVRITPKDVKIVLR